MSKPRHQMQLQIPQPPGGEPPPLADPRIAPFALARVAALPYALLVELAPPSTRNAVEAAVAARAQMERLRIPLEDALYQSLPAMPDAPARGRLLRVRRAVHNGRLPAAGDLAPELHDALPAQARAELAAWAAAAREAAAAEQAAETALSEEYVSHVRQGLYSLVGREDFLRPLALASPTLFAELCRKLQGPLTRSVSTKLDRALIAYAMRAAAKTSPFSTFMHVGLVQTTALPRPLLPAMAPTRCALAVINRSALSHLHQSLGGCCGRPEHTVLQRSASLRSDGSDAVQFLSTSFSALDERHWRLERAARVRLHPRLTASLQALPERFTLAELHADLERCGLSDKAALGFAARLREQGLVLLEPFTDAFDPAPGQGLTTRLARCGAPAPQHVAQATATLLAAAAALPTASAAERGAMVLHASRTFDAACRALPLSSPPHRLNLLLEQGYFSEPLGALPRPVGALLLEVAQVLGQRVVTRPAYQRLCELFLRRYGEDGRCDDVLGFCEAAAEQIPASSLWGPEAPSAEEPRLRRTPVSVFLQLVAQRSEAPGEDGLLAVVNQVLPGCGWHSARFATGDAPFHTILREQLDDWLRSAASPLEPVSFPVSGDCSPLQSHPQLTQRALAWPTEPLIGRSSVPVAALRLHYDPNIRRLVLTDDQGAALHPLALGAVPPHPSWGPRFWLCALAEPGHLPPMRDWQTPSTPGVDVEHRPRLTVGRVVLRRATWWMRSTWMKQAWFARRGARGLIDVAEACARHGLPRFLFARPSLSYEQASQGDARKPLWVDTRNPLCLELLAPLLEDHAWISMTEALPGPGGAAALPGLEGFTTELLSEMLV